MVPKRFAKIIIRMQDEMPPFGLPPLARNLFPVFLIRVLQNYEWCHHYYTVTVRKVKLTCECIFPD
jgi:hypothetical protein